MTDDVEKVEGVLARMGRAVVPVDSAEHELGRRAKIGQALDARIVAVGRASKSRRRSRRGALLVAAAVTCLLAGQLARSRFWVRPEAAAPVAIVEADHAIDLLHAGRHTTLDGGARPVEPEDEISLPGGANATVLLARGARVRVGERSRIRFVPTNTPKGHIETLELASGSVELRVPKLPAGDELRVRTADATVAVRGTRFRVTVEAGAPPWTTVEVFEGSVWVTGQEGELILRAGASWSSGHEPQPAASATAATSAPPTKARTTAEAGVSRSALQPQPTAGGSTPMPAPHASAEFDAPEGSGPPPAPENSTLGAENELYRRAVFAARSGDERTALRELEAFVRTFPASPLGENAKVERMRALTRLGPKPAAARAARAYLAEYPSGFARDEARGVAEAALGDER